MLKCETKTLAVCSPSELFSRPSVVQFNKIRVQRSIINNTSVPVVVLSFSNYCPYHASQSYYAAVALCYVTLKCELLLRHCLLHCCFVCQ